MADATKIYWRTKLLRGESIPTQQLMNLAQQAIDNFHAGITTGTQTEMAKFVDIVEGWLVRNRGRFWKMMQEEENNRS